MTNQILTPHTHLRRVILFSLAVLLFPVLTGLICDTAAAPPGTPEATTGPKATPLPEAMLTFRVELPSPLPPGDSISLDILDEVTGLALNKVSYAMNAEDPQHFVAILPFAMNSVIKYRYSRNGSSMAQEHISDGRPVRFRLHYNDGPGVINDVISRWTDTAFNGPTGRISGQVTDADSGAPVPNILLTAGGAQTITATDGSYLLEGLPPGTHNLVAYALDGAYRVFEQGALVAADSTTPAPVLLHKAPLVKVVFTVSVPKGTIPGVPLRFAGNLYQLGNTFADLSGGVSSLASRMPVLSPLPDGRYSISLDLPAGTDLRYKYTLGDGIWNAELKTDGTLLTRQLIVPDTQLLVDDRVETWSTGKSAPITFDTMVPPNTPPEDRVSIQFNPAFGWTEPIPMWKVSENRWIYVLYGPLDTVETIFYRYCRNEQCGSADDEATVGPDARGRAVSTSAVNETMDDPVKEWAWMPPSTGPTTIPNVDVKSHGDGFMAGIEFQPAYDPSWQPYFDSAIKDVRSLNANWAILTPTWTFTRSNLPVLEPLTSQDALWPDQTQLISLARGQELKVALFPTPTFPGGVNAWWKFGARDFAWWNVWFERYRTFILHYADMAAQRDVQAFILGGDWVTPALPGGTLSDGSLSNVPADAPARWHSLISDVRQHYKGTLLWALPYPTGVKNPPTFLSEVDQVYLLWSAPLVKGGNATPEGMASEAGNLLDKDVKPFQEQLGKPVSLALDYPSAEGGSTGCVKSPQGGCLELSALSRPNPDVTQVSVDLQDQVNAYSALMLAVNERNWISGLVSRGYYPPVILQDKSTSIHGKPARGLLWYWFPRLLGVPNP